MNETPRLLLADDQETFLHATAESLRQEGYQCDCAPDAHAAAFMLRSDHYDVLIADVKMPGNPNLELVRQVARSIDGLPVIIVSAYATFETAVNALDLPVWGYLKKPLDFEELLNRIRTALKFRNQYSVVHNQRKRLEEWLNSLEMVETLLVRTTSPESQVPVETFVALTMRNLYGALEDLQRVVLHQRMQGETDACHLIDCPRPARLIEAMHETIAVLEKTKSAFKSRELGALREKLEALVAEASAPATYRLTSGTTASE